MPLPATKRFVTWQSSRATITPMDTTPCDRHWHHRISGIIENGGTVEASRSNWREFGTQISADFKPMMG
jgi:hypothetical protein